MDVAEGQWNHRYWILQCFLLDRWGIFGTHVLDLKVVCFETLNLCHDFSKNIRETKKPHQSTSLLAILPLKPMLFLRFRRENPVLLQKPSPRPRCFRSGSRSSRAWGTPNQNLHRLLSLLHLHFHVHFNLHLFLFLFLALLVSLVMIFAVLFRRCLSTRTRQETRVGKTTLTVCVILLYVSCVCWDYRFYLLLFPGVYEPLELFNL